MNENVRRYTVLDGLFLAAWVALMAYAAFSYAQFPPQMPTHWDIHGQVNGTMPKALAVLLYLALPAFVYGLLWVVPGFDPLRGNYARFAPALGVMRAGGALVMTAISAAGLLAGAGHPVPMDRVVPFAVGALLVVVGNVMGQLKPNWFIGIRTPWTLSDEEVWRRTHRFAAYAFVASGVVMMLAGFVSAPWAVAAIVLVIAASLSTMVYSYVVWRSRHS